MLHFPGHSTPWFLAAWNAMAVDLHAERPEETSEDEDAEENGETSD